MGYMGFGMQSWIYKQKPRKPYTNSRRATGESNSSRFEFKLKPAFNLINSKLKAVIVLLIFFIVILYFGSLIFDFKDYYRIHDESVEQVASQQENVAFDFLYKSGLNYYNNADWKNARHEFELALKIKPNNVDLNTYYLSTLIAICKTGEEDYKTVLKHTNRILLQYPNNMDFMRIKEEAELLLETQK